MKKRILVLALSAALATGMLTACGGGSSTGSSAAASSAAGSAAASSAAASSAAASSAAGSSAASSSAASDGEFKKGLKGDGPTDLSCRYADFTVPAGLNWEVYTYNAKGSTGSVVMHMGKKSTGAIIFEVSTTRMVGPELSSTGKAKKLETIEEAANECYRMHGNSGKAERKDGEKVKIGNYEFQTLTIKDQYNDKTYLVTAYTSEGKENGYVEIGFNNKLKDDEMVKFTEGEGKAFIESLKLK